MHLRPSHCETESRITEANRIAGETGRQRQPGGHLSESTHDQVDDEPDKGVGYQDRGRLDWLEQALPQELLYLRRLYNRVSLHTQTINLTNSLRQCAPRANNQARTNSAANRCRCQSGFSPVAFKIVGSHTNHGDMTGFQATVKVNMVPFVAGDSLLGGLSGSSSSIKLILGSRQGFFFAIS